MKTIYSFLLLIFLQISTTLIWSQTQTGGYILQPVLIQSSRELYKEPKISYWGTSTISISPVGFDIPEPLLGRDALRRELQYYNPERWVIRKGYMIPREAIQQMEVILPGYAADNIRFNDEFTDNRKAHDHIFPLTHRTYKEEFFSYLLP